MSSHQCKSCGTPVDPSWNFCPKCNASLSGTAPEAPSRSAAEGGGGPLRGPDEIAFHQASGEELGSLLTYFVGKPIIIEEGTRGLLFINGKLAETLPPGLHRIGSFRERLEAKGVASSAVVIVRTGDLDVEINQAELRTKEQIPVNVKTKIAFRVGNPDLFYVNLMQGRERLGIAQLRSLLYEESRNALEEAIRAISVDDLRGDAATKRALETSVEEHLKRLLSRKGLDLIHFSAIAFSQEELESLRDVVGSAEMQRRQQEAERHQVAVDGDSVDLLLERQEVSERLRQAINRGRVSETNSEQEMADYFQEVKKRDILRGVELAEFERAFDEKSEDHEGARKHLLEKLAEERLAELDSLKQEHEQELASRGLLFEIDQARKLLEQELSQRSAVHAQEMKEVEDALSLRDRKNREKIERRRLAQQVELEGAKAAAGIQADRAQLEHDLANSRLEAETTAEISKAQAYAGLTSEQILAIKAADSPEAAAALTEKFRAEALATTAGQEKIEGLQERLIEQAQKQTEQAFDHARIAMETQRDATIGTAQGIRTGGTDGGGAQTRASVICPKCRYKIDGIDNPRHCPNCGSEL